MSRQSLRALCAVLSGFAFAAVAPAPAWAQVQPIPDLFEVDALAKREQVGRSETENIDPLSGALTLAYTDVHLPTNGGFDLKVVRSYRADRAGPYVSNTLYGSGFDSANSFRFAERTAGVGRTVPCGLRSATVRCICDVAAWLML